MSLRNATAILVALGLATAGCSGLTQQEQQALSGGAIGAAGGAVIGAMAGAPGVGAAIGGATGTPAGAMWTDISKRTNSQ